MLPNGSIGMGMTGTTLECCGRKRKDQRQLTCKRICCRTPVELDKDSNISLLQDFIKKNFLKIWDVCFPAIHCDTDGHNPHA